MQHSDCDVFIQTRKFDLIRLALNWLSILLYFKIELGENGHVNKCLFFAFGSLHPFPYLDQISSLTLTFVLQSINCMRKNRAQTEMKVSVNK